MRRLIGPAIVVLSLGLGGCASLLGIHDEVNVASEPTGASCRIERMSQPLAVINETPATVTLLRSRFPIEIYCTKDGSAGAEIVWPGVNPAVYLDIPLGGVPYLVDMLNDADLTLPDTVVVRFPLAR
jgi:hypothetical protein